MTTTFPGHSHGGRCEKCFDARWRDDLFDREAVTIPLVLPPATPPDGDLWIAVKAVRHETVFGKAHDHGDARLVTAVVKRGRPPGALALVDDRNRLLPADHPAMQVLFPPKTWMTDSLEERCSMLAAGRLARGRVLVGGLGLALYPQYVLHLQRPVSSLTIVERDPTVIRLVSTHWPREIDRVQCPITIVEASIEEYLETTEAKFETVFLDTWEDSDPRLLPHVNHLIGLARQRCAPAGRIQCWSYALMVAAVQREVLALVDNGFGWTNYRLDPVLAAFGEWFARQRAPTRRQIVRKLWTLATSVAVPASSYDPGRCFCALASSSFAAALVASVSRFRE